jgi:hypothetical protein
MKKLVILLIILITLIISTFSGCTEDNRFIGTWKSQFSITYVFKSDGDLIVGGVAGNWKIEEEKLILQTPDNSFIITVKYSYSFSDNDQLLTLTDSSSGLTKILTKQ